MALTGAFPPNLQSRGSKPGAPKGLRWRCKAVMAGDTALVALNAGDSKEGDLLAEMSFTSQLASRDLGQA